jgi:ribosomal protein S18 acetylase RimI-like enzyme
VPKIASLARAGGGPVPWGRLAGVVSVRTAEADDVEGCVGVLARLPDHFTPDTHDEVRRDLPGHPAWVATDGEEGEGRVVAFVLVQRRYPTTAEITYAAVAPELRRTGIGTALVDAALAVLAADGVVVVEVKTLDASAGYEPYVATRAFWERCGFHQIDCIDPLPGWQPGNPSALYVAALSPTR